MDKEGNWFVIKGCLKKADFLMEEVLSDYFWQYSPTTADGRLSVCWEFERTGVKVDIISDMLRMIREAVCELCPDADPDALPKDTQSRSDQKGGASA